MKNARFLQPHFLHQLEIFLHRPDPTCDFRVAVIPLLALPHRFLVSLGVQEELTLPDHSVGASQLMKHVIEVNNLLHRVRRPGLLPVSKSRIGDEDLFRRIGIDKLIVKCDPANLFVREDVSIEVWLLDIQKGKGLHGVFALERSLPSCDAHSLSLFFCKLLTVNA